MLNIEYRIQVLSPEGYRIKAEYKFDSLLQEAGDKDKGILVDPAQLRMLVNWQKYKGLYFMEATEFESLLGAKYVAKKKNIK